MTRIAAALAAVALVVAALVIRSRIDENERRGPYRLTCAAELAEVCRSIDGEDVEVSIEPAGTTVASLAGDDQEFEGWLAAGPWTDSSGAVKDTRVLGHSRVGAVIWRDRAAALRRACGQITAKCLGDAAARGSWAANRGDAAWGQVKLAYADPVAESAGLAALAAGTASVIGSVDIVPAALEANDAYLGWLHAFARARVDRDLAAILATGPAVADAYIGLDAQIAPLLAQAARRSDLEVVYLAPVNVEARLATSSGARRAPAGLDDALLANGWKSAPEQGAANPSTGAWAGLRRIWEDTIR